MAEGDGSQKEYTYSDVSEHREKNDILIVVHDKVYNATSFVDEHPGGEEVLLDVGGQDATEAFEDVGHSDEAREILDGLLVGKLKRMPGDPKPKIQPPATSVSTSAAAASTTGAAQSGSAASFGIAMYAALVVGGAIAFMAYQYMQKAGTAERT